MSSEAQRIGKRIAHLFFHRRADGVIQIALSVRLPGSHSLVYIIFLHRFRADYKFHAACRAQQMTNHGLGGIDDHILCRFAEGCLDGPCLLYTSFLSGKSVADLVHLQNFFPGQLLRLLLHGQVVLKPLLTPLPVQGDVYKRQIPFLPETVLKN